MTQVRFEYGATADVSHVELLGEASDWRNGIPLTADASGALASEVTLGPGVYQYKFLVRAGTGTSATATFLVDPTNARTRSADGRQNSLVVVGGAPEPWLIAPKPPWIVELARGGLRVLVGLRRSAARRADDLPTVAWSEDGGRTWTRGEALLAFEEDEHWFYVATLPASAATLLVAVEGRDAPRFEAAWSRTPAAERLPEWWHRAAIYCIFVDRFRPENDDPSWERDRDLKRRASAGGHLEGIRRSLDELADLGIDVLYLTPVHVGASCHRYDVVDPLRVDPALGGEEAYEALVRDARTRGMRVVQDVSFAHAGRGFPPYEDVRAAGRTSQFAPWFVWRDGALAHYGKRSDAPLFDTRCPEVQALALDVVDFWAARGVSGLRLDMTAEVPLDLGRQIRRRFRQRVPDGVVFGELVPQHAWRWRNAEVLDASTDFAFHEVVTELVCSPKASAADAFEKLRRTELLRGDDARLHSVRFLSTHDHPRLATLAARAGGLARLRCAYALLATLPGIPMLLYGEEHALRSNEPHRDPEDVWPDRMPMPWGAVRRDPEMAGAIRALLRARAASPALSDGPVRLLFADETTLVYRREVEGEIVDVALSFASEPRALEIADDEHPRLSEIASVGGAAVSGTAVSLPPCSAILLRRQSALGRVSPIAARRNLALRDRDLAAGAARAESRPSRFLFAVTERCNLACEHCITHAPERTRSGAARTMTSAVLDAIAPDLALGEYFAFVHGGESLTAPIFFDVLDAVAAGRGSEPYVAHLLTNGVLLDVSCAARLVRSGVSSVSVSLDGATAETNDAIRVGGRFRLVVDNLRAVASWRRTEGVDLRLGISTVVLAQNVHELEALVELGAEVGVDWVKLEEGAPATPFAKRSLVSCGSPEVRGAIDAALARGRARGLTMVDHTVERTVWRCRLDDETRTFLEADELANRCTIHPCRTPWETACIEPNGDVRAKDFFGPVLGNVTQTPLSSLWNAEAAQRARREAAQSRLCGPHGPVTCV
jgi:glycosidase/MoaA/NifB/PqqE/SkfB family radical SAM enzyme